MPTIDLTRLTAFCTGDRTRMERYIRAYMDAQPDGMAQLKEMLANGDARGVAVVAHSLRPQSTFMGAEVVLEVLTTIEQHARSDDLAACAAPIATLEVLQMAVTAELRAFLDQ
ncbi:MAG: hypothetical protein KBH07_05460 [Flavobacteriales bacterium]|nr:hypothetical protein [Flavobacteriales bacterium]MBP9081033.1 hypothetical protein [Flavobacteriales bacterium]